MPAGTTPTVYIEHDTAVVTWTSETGNSQPFWCARFIANCVQITSGGTANVTGSNDNLSFFPLHDAKSPATALSAVAPGLYEVVENPVWVRIEAASGTVSAILVARTAA